MEIDERLVYALRRELCHLSPRQVIPICRVDRSHSNFSGRKVPIALSATLYIGVRRIGLITARSHTRWLWSIYHVFPSLVWTNI